MIISRLNGNRDMAFSVIILMSPAQQSQDLSHPHWKTSFPLLLEKQKMREIQFFFLSWLRCTACGILVLDQVSNLCPLWQKHRVLTTGLPGNSYNLVNYLKFYLVLLCVCVCVCVCVCIHIYLKFPFFSLNKPMHNKTMVYISHNYCISQEKS